jgi:hypothetical protein
MYQIDVNAVNEEKTYGKERHNTKIRRNMKRSFDADMDFTPIRTLVVKYDMPHDLANRFVGESENETDRLVNMFIEWMEKRNV